MTAVSLWLSWWLSMRSDWRRPESWSLPAEGERRIKLVISYDGAAYHGWQSQDGVVSVQSELSAVLSSVLEKETMAYASGRTDSGVHALGQCCHFDTSSQIDPEKYAVILNTRLPKTIRVRSSELAPEGFHARFSTMSREYWYLIKRERDMLPFDDRHVMALRCEPDISLLNAYATTLIGTHDFTTFASARDPSESRFRDLYVSWWDILKDTYGFYVLRYRTAGNAFLYHQVRSMVGTMLCSMTQGESPEAFKRRLDAKDRSCALRTAPADGLYLAEVSYDSSKYQWFEELYAR